MAPNSSTVSGSRSGLHSHEPAELQNYRSISPLAVIALFLALLSLLALATPAGWLFPLPAIMCAIAALWRIQKQPDRLAGRPVALVALAMAVVFGAWGPTQFFVTRSMLKQQATQFAHEWFDLVLAGELEAAHQAVVPYYLRQPVGADLKDYYAEHPDDLKELETFFARGIARDLVQLNGQGTYELERTEGIYFESTTSYVTQRYRFYHRETGDLAAHVQIALARELDDQAVYWSVIGLVDADVVDERERM